MGPDRRGPGFDGYYWVGVCFFVCFAAVVRGVGNTAVSLRPRPTKNHSGPIAGWGKIPDGLIPPPSSGTAWRGFGRAAHGARVVPFVP